MSTLRTSSSASCSESAEKIYRDRSRFCWCLLCGCFVFFFCFGWSPVVSLIRFSHHMSLCWLHSWVMRTARVFKKHVGLVLCKPVPQSSWTRRRWRSWPRLWRKTTSLFCQLSSKFLSAARPACLRGCFVAKCLAENLFSKLHSNFSFQLV